jgi:hypothetical protein
MKKQKLMIEDRFQQKTEMRRKNSVVATKK